MNEKIKKAGIAFIVILVVFGAGFLGGRYNRSGELREIENKLREAENYSAELREKLEESTATVDGLETIAKQRQRTIEELREEVQFAIARARERDQIIARLEGQVGSLSADTAELRELIGESESIVNELLGQTVPD